MCVAVEGANAPATPFGTTRKVSHTHTHEAGKEGSFNPKKVFFYP